MAIERFINVRYEDLALEQKTDGSFPLVIRQDGHKYELSSHDGFTGRYELNLKDLVKNLEEELKRSQYENQIMRDALKQIADMA